MIELSEMHGIETPYEGSRIAFLKDPDARYISDYCGPVLHADRPLDHIPNGVHECCINGEAGLLFSHSNWEGRGSWRQYAVLTKNEKGKRLLYSVYPRIEAEEAERNPL